MIYYSSVQAERIAVNGESGNYGRAYRGNSKNKDIDKASFIIV